MQSNPSPPVYDASFYAAVADGSFASAQAVAPFLLDILAPEQISSVADLGCGRGAWLRAFQDLGIHEVLGIDGDYVERDALLIPRDRFHAHNLETELRATKIYDLALSVEVAEHLESSAAGVFVRSLVQLAPVIAFSAAIPSQGGTHHVNEQWPEYWAELFAQHQYCAVDCRQALWDDERIEPHYRQNLLIFVATQHLHRYPKLQEWHQKTPSRIARLVHPGVFQRWVDWGMSQSEAYWDLALNRVRAAEE